MTVKKKVATCAFKKEGVTKDGKPYKIYEVVFEDLSRADCFDECKEGEEVEGELIESANPAYNPSFKLKKAAGGTNGKFPAKDWTSEKRIASLKCATDLVCAGKITFDQLSEAREKFYLYLNTK